MPPLSSLTLEQQQKCFSWIKQLNPTTESEKQSHTLNTNILASINQQQNQQSLKNIFKNDLFDSSCTSHLNNDIGAIGSERLRANDNTVSKNSFNFFLPYLSSHDYKKQNKILSPFVSCTAVQSDHPSDTFRSSNNIILPVSQFSSNALFSKEPNKNNRFGSDYNTSTVFGNQSIPLLSQQQHVSQLKNVPFSVTTNTSSGHFILIF